MSETTRTSEGPDPTELAERVRLLKARFGEFRGRL
jgi:hypothetical protein